MRLLVTVLALAFTAGSSLFHNSLYQLAVRGSRLVAGSLQIQVLVTAGGQPDDIAVDAGGHLVWGDIARGNVYRLVAGEVSTLVRGLSVPEGVLALPHGVLLVTEQGTDQIDRIGPHGARRDIYSLQPVPGQEGVDGIGRDPKTGDLLVPDSPRGAVLRMTASGAHARVITSGLGRPVDAAEDSHGNVLVPDEHLGTLVVIAPNGRVTYRGSFSTPDDVAVTASGTIWVTSLGDGSLWQLLPGGAPRRILSGLGNPQGLTLDRCGDPIVVDQSSTRILRVLLTSRSKHCAL